MTEATIEIATQLDSPDLGVGHSLQPLLASALKDRPQFQPANDRQAFWPAEHFHLDKVALFRGSSEEEQQEILSRCNDSLLAEAYYIEKCGMYFAPKMSLLAENTQEKMLYSLIAADEATHFNWLARFVSASAVADYLHNPFIQLLDDILQYGDKTTLTYIVQVILEGWGIRHYHALATDARDATLKDLFTTILKDEARHHGSGLILFNDKRLSAKQAAGIADTLIQFFRMVQMGPQIVVAQIGHVKGHLSKSQRAAIFTELDAEAATARKLEMLKSLICSAAYASEIIGALERAGSLKAFTAAECAAVG